MERRGEEEGIHERCMTIPCVNLFCCEEGGGVLICGVEATISKAYLDLVHES
jgi:hypothetical protein